MTQTQRLIAIVTCLVVACIMHTLICEWYYKVLDNSNSGSRPTFLVVFRQTDSGQFTASRRSPRPMRETTGIAVQGSPDRAAAALNGIGVPLMLVGVAAILGAGWRRASRKARGLCIRCGYPVTGDTCTECGTVA